MSLRAHIMYDEEIEQVKVRGSLDSLLLADSLMRKFPSEDPQIILYTVSEYVKVHGTNAEPPSELIYPDGYHESLPNNTVVEAPVEPEPKPETAQETDFDTNYSYDTVTKETQEDPREYYSRRHRTRKNSYTVNRNIDTRSISDEYEALKNLYEGN